MKLKSITLAIALLPVFAMAAEESKPLPPTFSGHGENSQRFIEAHDLNNDGVLTWDEFKQFRRRRFDATDTNGNGVIELNEYIAEFDARMNERLKPELEQIRIMTERRFISLAGGGTHISREKFDASSDRMYAMFEKNRFPDMGDASDRPQPMLDMPTNHTRNGMLALYDFNNDGQLPREEFDKMRDEQFKRTDINRDGRISYDEYVAEFQQRVDAALYQSKVREKRQTAIRFGVLDKAQDDRMTWEEYMASGKRLFDSNDRNNDGRIDALDVALPAPKRGQ